MDFSKVIEQRRSVRQYTEKPVPAEVIERGFTQALLAPNTSNIQPWEFYWVKSEDKKERVVEACFNQPAARTAQELIVAVANLKSWKRNRLLLIKEMRLQGETPETAFAYYEKLLPIMYTQGPFSLFGYLKSILAWTFGWFKVLPRSPCSHSDLREILVKTVALGCENFMLSMTDQGYGSCPMEGFDSSRLKKALGLKRYQHVVMVISVGEVDEKGILGQQIRLDRNLFVKII